VRALSLPFFISTIPFQPSSTDDVAQYAAAHQLTSHHHLLTSLLHFFTIINRCILEVHRLQEYPFSTPTFFKKTTT
jgi:hypothetical protein